MNRALRLTKWLAPAAALFALAYVDAPGVLSPVGFVSIDEVRLSSGVPDLVEGRKFFDLGEVDAPDN